MGALSTHAVNPSLYAKMPYDAVKDFAPITLVAITPNVLVVNAVAAGQLGEGIHRLREGESRQARVRLGQQRQRRPPRRRAVQGRDRHRHRRTCRTRARAPATQALLAGDTQFMFDNLANAMPQVKAGKLRALAVTTAQRSTLAPDLPTMAEAGVPGLRHLDVVRPARARRHAAGRRSPSGTPRS